LELPPFFYIGVISLFYIGVVSLFYIGVAMNFELLSILTDYANYKKGGMKFKKIFSSETTEPISTKKFIKNPVIYVKKLIIMLI
jgi:hypothetical protein